MQIEKVINQVGNGFEGGIKKRFACSHCGKVWVEVVGLFAGSLDEKDIYFQVGNESEVCQNCRFRVRSCPTCGSKDAYEINFPTKEAQDSTLSFGQIRIVRKTEL